MNELKIRKLDFDFSLEDPEFWYDSNPLMTFYFNVMSLTVTAGEGFLISTMREIKEAYGYHNNEFEIDGLIHQEARHKYIHGKYNEIVEGRGHNTKLVCFFSDFAFNVVCSSRMPLKVRAAFAVAFECYTELMSLITLDPELSQYLYQEDVYLEPEYKRLWEWHSAEELEHKNVCFDVYESIGGGYLLRILCLILATMFFVFQINYGISVMSFEKRKHLKLKHYIWVLKSTTNFSFLKKIGKSMAKFYRRSYSPSAYDYKSLIEEWESREYLVVDS